MMKYKTFNIKNSFSLESNNFKNGLYGFNIRFKCMEGETSQNGKFIMPLPKKMTYFKSVDRCNG